MYHVEALPIHPPPQALETLTSYLTRLAEANGFRSVAGLAHLIGVVHTMPSWNDLPPKFFGRLPQAAQCSEDRLLETTVYHLGHKFGRTRLSSFTKFLAGSLADYRRFCPTCLAETGYERLPWRFHQIVACVEHHCLLLDRCPCCDARLPLLASPLILHQCVHCGGDLRDAGPSRLTDIVTNQQRWQELVYLLTAQPWQAQQPLTLNIARQILSAMRRQRGILSCEVAALLSIDRSPFQMLENDLGRMGGDLFVYYQKYAHFLGLSLEALFKQAAHDVYKSKTERFEDARLAAVEQVIHELKEQGLPVTQRRVGERLGVEPGVLRSMPRVHARLRQAALERDGKTAQQEQALLERVETTIQRLRAQGQRASVRAIAAELKVRESFFNQFPRVTARLRILLQEKEREKQQYAEGLLQTTRQIVQEMQQENAVITAKAVARQLNMSDSNLENYPAIQAYLKTVVLSPQIRRQQHEAMLVERAQTAIAQLRSEGKFPTRKAVTAMTGISRSAFNYYPRLKEMRAQFLHARGPAHEEHLLEKVRIAVQELRAEGKPITRSLLEEKVSEVGLTYNTLKYYPSIRRLWRESLDFPSRRSAVQ